jgi:hypothetical protein
MKCDTCKKAHSGHPTYDDPADDTWCTAGHWEGIEPCKDYDRKDIVHMKYPIARLLFFLFTIVLAIIAIIVFYNTFA